MIELKMREGDGDASRTGYWDVTGPQDEHEVNGLIERARSFESGTVFFAWYLNQRSTPEKNNTNTFMVTIDQGEAPTVDEALSALRLAWQREVGESVHGMPRVEADIELPWRDE
jgi:hypothetical protein